MALYRNVANFYYTDFILRTVDQKKITAVVYFDMNKAFESIDHVILLKNT